MSPGKRIQLAWSERSNLEARARKIDERGQKSLLYVKEGARYAARTEFFWSEGSASFLRSDCDSIQLRGKMIGLYQGMI